LLRLLCKEAVYLRRPTVNNGIAEDSILIIHHTHSFGVKYRVYSSSSGVPGSGV
jgi:hypothetical protein